MKIKSVRIQNFRALKDVEISFDEVTTFIGPNGTGKSTVLRALDWFFNGKVGAITEKDCAFGAIEENIEVQVTFQDLTDTDRAELGKYVPAGASTFTAWRCRTPDGSEALSANSRSYEPFNLIREKGNAAERKTAYNELLAADSSLGLPAWTKQDEATQAMVAWESVNTSRLTEAPENLQTNFFGFNSSGKMSGLFDFVLVTADLRAGEESTDGRVSIIGRILERSIDRAAADAEIAVIVESSRLAQQRVYDDKFKDQLEAITTRLNEVVASYSPGRAITVSPSEVELRAPRTTFEVGVMDGATETQVERQGHGFQRTLLVSALQLLAQSGSASAEGVICLAIEEPELFQHPIQAQAFAKVLRSLAEDAGKRIQVTYATHSPYFVEARHFDQVRRLTRSTDAAPIVTVHSATLTDVRARLAGVLAEGTVGRQLDGIITNQLSVALFANRAFVVEGTTETAVFSGLGDKVAMGSMETNGIAIVAVGGKSSIPLAHAVLTSVGIPTYALFDGDDGFESRAVANGKTVEKIAEEQAGHVTKNRAVLKYFGLPEVDFPTDQVGRDVAIFGDNLEAFLTENWPEWIESCRVVESTANIRLSKNASAYRTATLEAGGAAPQVLGQILAKASGG